MNLEQIAQYTIDYADGAFYLDWHEDFDKLTAEQKQLVRDKVFAEVGDCVDCGWHWTYESMEVCSDGQERCWQCVDVYYEEEE